MSVIQEFFDGRTVFVTGSTGFMGKVLLEKLLRSCPALRRVYILIRTKRGVSVSDRLKQLLNSKLFDKVRRLQPDFSSKVVSVSGDILEQGLGLSDDDVQRLTTEVSVVFHSAATVKFDSPLKVSVQMNVIGVRRLMDVCRKIIKLEAIVHISTAYANCDKKTILETVYPPPLSPAKIINAMEWMDESTADLLTPRLVPPRPNTYTFTKAIAECLLVEECGSLPIAIVRPSIVGASWKEPFQGWVDNFNGLNGFLVAIGKGMLRTMWGNFDGCADIIPVDTAVNLIIAVAWNTAVERPSSIPVFNSTSGAQNRLTWGNCERASYDYFMKNPFDSPVRLPSPRLTQNRIYYELKRWFDHMIPAWLADGALRLVGKKPFLTRIENRIWNSISSLEYFTSNQWQFSNDNVIKLYNRLCTIDRQEFNFDVKNIDWPTYLENYYLGVKLYALHEDPAGLPKARRTIQMLVILRGLKRICVLLAGFHLVFRSNFSRRLVYYLTNIALRVYNALAKFANSCSRK